MQDLIEGAGLESPGWSTWGEVYDALSEEVGAFRGTSSAAIGLLGVPIREPASAGA